MPEPVPSSEEEEETQEVVCSDTPLRVLSQYHQCVVQLSSLVGPVHHSSNSPQSIGPYSMDGH